jgi:hypothetical protein
LLASQFWLSANMPQYVTANNFRQTFNGLQRIQYYDVIHIVCEQEKVRLAILKLRNIIIIIIVMSKTALF